MVPTEMSATQLAEAIQSKTLSVSEVVRAHIERIEEVNDTLNAVIWPLYKQAMDQAAADDRALARGKQQGALFGVPMTIKDQFMIRGTPTSVGLAHRSQTVIDDEGPLVGRLREQGAIFLGKTSVPQLLLTHECEHGLYGHCKNPFDPSRVPGGSSGGEASIIGAGGSPVGLGGDMGGSIRIPAHCCGISGLKPTNSRLTNDDAPLLQAFGALAGFEGFVVQPGPMARSVDDLKLVMDCLLSEPMQTKDVVPPVPWRTGPLERPAKGLRIGIFRDNGFFTPSKSVQRVVDEAGVALSDAGMELVPFSIPGGSYPIELAYDLLCAGGGAWIKGALKGDTPTVTIKGLMQSTGLPNVLRKPLSGLLGLLGQACSSKMLKHSATTDANTYWELTAARSAYRARFLEAMDEERLDLLLCPSYGLPAPHLDSNASGVVSMAGSYTLLFNFLGNPAGTVAMGNVREDEQSSRPASKDPVYEAARSIDKGSAGLPLGVQVIGRHWREDQVLSIMKTLQEHFGIMKRGPGKESSATP